MRTTTSSQEPEGGLGEMAAHVRARAELEQRKASRVRAARNQGFAWEQMASTLGVSKQAVRKKHRGGQPVQALGSSSTLSTPSSRALKIR